MTARVFKSGRLGVRARLDPRSYKATLDLAATIEPIPLKTLNDFTKAYAKFAILKKVPFALATELATKDGQITGYHQADFRRHGDRQYMDGWAYRHGVKLDFIRPGRPVENGYIQRLTSASASPFGLPTAICLSTGGSTGDCGTNA